MLDVFTTYFVAFCDLDCENIYYTLNQLSSQKCYDFFQYKVMFHVLLVIFFCGHVIFEIPANNGNDSEDKGTANITTETHLQT